MSFVGPYSVKYSHLYEPCDFLEYKVYLEGDAPHSYTQKYVFQSHKCGYAKECIPGFLVSPCQKVLLLL